MGTDVRFDTICMNDNKDRDLREESEELPNRPSVEDSAAGNG